MDEKLRQELIEHLNELGKTATVREDLKITLQKLQKETIEHRKTAQLFMEEADTTRKKIWKIINDEFPDLKGKHLNYNFEDGIVTVELDTCLLNKISMGGVTSHLRKFLEGRDPEEEEKID